MEGQVEEHEMDKMFEILEEVELRCEESSESDTKKAGVKFEDQEPKEKKAFESEDDSDDEMRSVTPEMEGASIVKYNVKTTPYLQR